MSEPLCPLCQGWGMVGSCWETSTSEKHHAPPEGCKQVECPTCGGSGLDPFTESEEGQNALLGDEA